MAKCGKGTDGWMVLMGTRGTEDENASRQGHLACIPHAIRDCCLHRNRGKCERVLHVHPFIFFFFFRTSRGPTRLFLLQHGPTDLLVATTHATMHLLILFVDVVAVVVVFVLADHHLPATVSIPFESCDSSSRRQSLASLSLFSVHKSSHRTLAPPSPFLLSFALCKTHPILATGAY